MNEFIHILTILFGSCTVALAAYLSYRFYKHHHVLSNAFMIMLIAEMITCIVGVVFAANAYISDLQGVESHIATISGGLSTTLRWVMFLATSISSLHLWIKFQGLPEGEELCSTN